MAAASPLANPTATKEMLERFGLATKHRLGQNFLIDNHVIEHILKLASLTEDDYVVEVGPGIGTLTLGLLSQAGRVVSIEADSELEPVLEEHQVMHENFSFIMGDALKVSAEQMADCLDGHKPNILVSNLPYNVAATIILQYFQQNPEQQACVVMVQKEVADRICATPGNKIYGAYTAKLNLYGHVTGRFEVPPRCFMPAPHVDSAVVRIDRNVSEIDLGTNGLTIEYCARVIDAAFAQRRKTIRNSMSASGFDKQVLDQAFEASNIAPSSRAEKLSYEEFVALARFLLELECQQ